MAGAAHWEQPSGPLVIKNEQRKVLPPEVLSVATIAAMKQPMA